MIRRVSLLTTHPATAFSEIIADPRFLAAWMLATILFAAPMIAAVQRIGPARLFDTVVAVMQQQPDLAGESKDTLAEPIGLIFEFFAVLTPMIAVPLTAVCLLPLVAGLHGRATFRQLMAVTAYAMLPPVLGMAITTAAILLLRDPRGLSLDSLAPLNLGVLVPATASRLLHNILSTVELFSAWSVYLLVWGVAIASGIEFRRVFLALAVPLIVVAWLIAGLAAML